MRLSKIKLAGFKSFVDPTTIKLPSNMTGIVGPNGCGKSNVIDAVRWVMGESSAKHLRGSSMEDVIFNGSSSRKPVGMATVELVFDNSAGKVGGQFANYNEISVRRTLSRESGSKYYLNGTKCRRRDIADLFLGTGLGPRSYAIIEQGMISRLIEAKPEELRIFLEEAAGISKYKERRKETENRIRHTRDNLDRLNDLRDEIDKQLSHLQRQSKAAEKYKELKQEERKLKAELMALRWRDLSKDLEGSDKQINDTQIQLEKVIAELRATELKIEQHRQDHVKANDEMNAVQEKYYSVGADISRIEQSIKHQQELKERQQTDLQQIELSLDEMLQTLHVDKAASEQIEKELSSIQPEYESIKADEGVLTEKFSAAEQAMRHWQTSWDDINQQYSDASQQAQVEKSRMEELEKHVQQLRQRLHKIIAEQQALLGENMEQQIKDIESKAELVIVEKQAKEATHAELLKDIQDTREQIVVDESKASELRREVYEYQGQLSSLTALQQSALGKKDQSLGQWLERRGLSDKNRVAEQITVDSGWEKAVETVLGDTLEAVCVETIASYRDSLAELTESSLSLIESGSPSADAANVTDCLSDKVKSAFDLSEVLYGVKVADDLKQGFAMRASLKSYESIITRQGIWLGKNWLRVNNEKDEKRGVLERENEIRDIGKQVSKLEEELATFETRVKEKRTSLNHKEHQREELQDELNRVAGALSDLQSQIKARQTRMEHISDQGKNLDVEKAEIETLTASEDEAIKGATRVRNAALNNIELLSNDRVQLESQRDDLRDQLQQHKETLQQQQSKSHELAIRVEGLNTRNASLEQNIARMQQSQTKQKERKEELLHALTTASEPVEKLETELKILLENRLTTETALSAVRNKVDALAHDLRALENQRAETETSSQDVRSKLEKIKLDSQDLRTRCKTILEQLAETGFEAKVLLGQLDEMANSSEWDETVAKIAARINRLGPINLAAIDEYQELLKRKEYLDEQYTDVVTALETLEKAIAKIDAETRGRFKDTYDHVNSRLNDMFPRLFGGGTAYLEMTGDDLLSTGVTVMAKPPGKRISNIHLMSGGEKALTAVALVFAIFELNPAPFCMLDEVDAPLDEANVVRFGQLVKEMSKNVQFIFITHNKSTMEISEQLSGVTMREAGVSRLVTVDIAEAATMAAV